MFRLLTEPVFRIWRFMGREFHHIRQIPCMDRLRLFCIRSMNEKISRVEKMPAQTASGCFLLQSEEGKILLQISCKEIVIKKSLQSLLQAFII